MASPASRWRDLALELLAVAKTGRGDRTITLMQVGDIVLNRDVSLVDEMVPEMLEFMTDRAADVRRYLVEASGAALEKSLAPLAPTLNMYNHLVTDTSEVLVMHITRELCKAYDKMVMNIVNVPIKTKQSGPGADPKQMWQHLRTVATRLVDVISSNRGEPLREACLNLAESIVLFGLPAPPVSHDPRQRRVAVNKEATLSSDNVPLHHAFINRNELEQEAEDTFKKMLLWATRGGPQGFPFTPAQMSLLGQAIARIASQRPRKASGGAGGDDEGRGSFAAKALIFLLTGKTNVCKEMSGASRESLAKATHGLLRSPFSSMADPDGLVGKLRGALTSLEALGFEDGPDAAAAAAAASKKRPASEISSSSSGKADDGDEVMDMKRRAASNALEAAEQAQKSRQQGSNEAALAGGMASGTDSLLFKSETELAGDTAVPFELSATARGALASVTHKTTISGNSDVVTRLLPPTAQSAGELAMAALQRLLDSFWDVKGFSEKALEGHAKLAARMAASMALVDIASNKPPARVPLILSVAAGCPPKLAEGVPLELFLPLPLWMLVSFVLSPARDDQRVPGPGGSAHPMPLAVAVKEKMVIALSLLEDLRDRVEAEAEADGTEAAGLCATLYETVCTALLARLLQNLHLRDLAQQLVVSLPWVPKQALQLLKLLMHTGTKAAVVAAPSRVPGKREARNRGTRMEALVLLTHLVFAADEAAGASSLNHLLWCAVSDEFETRSKAVTLLINDVMPGGEWVQEIIVNFACQAAGNIVGPEAAALGAEESARLRRQKWELPSELKAKAESEAEAAAAAAVAGAATGTGAGDAMDVDAPKPVYSAHPPTGDNMDVAAEQEAEAEAETPDEGASLGAVMAAFSGGTEFEGSFPPTAAAAKDRFEAHVRRSVQLLLQLCATHPRLLGLIMDIAGAAARAWFPEGEAEAEAGGSQQTSASAVAEGEAAVDGADAAPAPAPAPAEGATEAEADVFGPRQHYKALLDVLKGELSNILPVVVQASSSGGRPTHEAFGLLARSDPRSAPLLQHALGVLHNDMHLPPTPRLMETVGVFLRLNALDSPAKRLKYQVSLLGGMPGDEVRELLPSVLALLGANTDGLNTAFSRIVMARPPALTKSALLVALHRFVPLSLSLSLSFSSLLPDSSLTPPLFSTARQGSSLRPTASRPRSFTRASACVWRAMTSRPMSRTVSPSCSRTSSRASCSCARQLSLR